MHFVTFGSSGSDCEKERAVRTCVRGQGSCFQGKRYQRDLRFFTHLVNDDGSNVSSRIPLGSDALSSEKRKLLLNGPGVPVLREAVDLSAIEASENC